MVFKDQTKIAGFTLEKNLVFSEFIEYSSGSNKKERVIINKSQPRVHNKHHGTAPPDAVYIGRGSIYGNPFVIDKHGDRDEVCEAYESMLFSNQELLAKVRKNLRGKDLVCFCSPKRCHGDTLLRVANETEA